MLLDVGCKVVLFDDLLMHKLGDFSSHVEESFRLELKKLGIERVLADKDSMNLLLCGELMSKLNCWLTSLCFSSMLILNSLLTLHRVKLTLDI